MPIGLFLQLVFLAQGRTITCPCSQVAPLVCVWFLLVGGFHPTPRIAGDELALTDVPTYDWYLGSKCQKTQETPCCQAFFEIGRSIGIPVQTVKNQCTRVS